MINAILNGIFSVIQGLVSVILAPIDLLLANIPYINNAAQGIADFVAIIKDSLRWAFDIFPPLTKIAFTSVMLTIAFFWNASFSVKMLKLVYGWIQKLKWW